MGTCIFCKKEFDKFSLEHIIPDSLGCPPDLILKNEVCVGCNNGLSKLDNRVIQAFDMMRWMNGVPNKKGKAPSISSIRNIFTDDKGFDGEKRLVVNAGKLPVKVEDAGKTLPGKKTGSSSVEATFRTQGKEGIVNMRQTFETDRLFIRGVYKIGFEIQCYLDGGQRMLDPYFDSFRDFIVYDKGEMELFYRIEDDQSYQNVFKSAFSHEDGRKLIEVRLVCVSFMVNLTKDEEPYDRLFKYMNENKSHKLKYVKTVGEKVEYY